VEPPKNKLSEGISSPDLKKRRGKGRKGNCIATHEGLHPGACFMTKN